MNDKILEFARSDQTEALSAQEILTWAIKNIHPRIALATSFGAPEGMIVLDMMQRIDASCRVFMLDTGRLPQETYNLMDRVRDRYDVEIEVVFPTAEAVERMVRERGPNLFYESIESRKLCCRVRKVEPLNRYLGALDGWITGLRREQNVTRTDTPKVEIDSAHRGIVKVNPIADWTAEQVTSYATAHDVPTNRLHLQGYPSVGCAPCSRAIRPGEDPRAGRWWWESPETKECGIHLGQEEQGSGI